MFVCLRFRLATFLFAASIWTQGVAEEWIVDSNTSLAYALQRLSQGDTVTVMGGNYSGESCNLTVKVSNVAIKAHSPNSVIINCNMMARHLNIDGRNVEVQGISFNNGFSQVSGGCVVVNQPGCVIRDCRFSYCSTVDSGGGIMLRRTATNSSIINSEFIQCSAWFGGAIYVESGSDLMISGSFYSQESTATEKMVSIFAGDENRSASNLLGRIIGNSAKIKGGAMYVGEGAKLTFSGLLLFRNNSATLNGPPSAGGALYASGSSVVFSVHSNLTFEDNICAGFGGAIALLNRSSCQMQGSISLTGSLRGTTNALCNTSRRSPYRRQHSADWRWRHLYDLLEPDRGPLLDLDSRHE